MNNQMQVEIAGIGMAVNSVGADQMDRDRNPSERNIIEGLMGDDPDMIAWLVRIGLVEIGSDGRCHATTSVARLPHMDR